MTRHDPTDPVAPVDQSDLALLEELRQMYETVDPVPEHLVERILFAVALEELDAGAIEVLRPDPGAHQLVGARASEDTRTITFDGERVTVMVSIIDGDHDTVRLDGWLAPPAEHPVELRTERGSLRTRCDRDGRFALHDVPHGLAQLVVHPVADGVATGAVVTPSVVL